MRVPVDIWLRGENHATTAQIDGIAPAPASWTDEDVRAVLEGMLREMDRLKRPGEDAGDPCSRHESAAEIIIQPCGGGSPLGA